MGVPKTPVLPITPPGKVFCFPKLSSHRCLLEQPQGPRVAHNLSDRIHRRLILAARKHVPRLRIRPEACASGRNLACTLPALQQRERPVRTGDAL